jgi:FkbM family methyltransferase
MRLGLFGRAAATLGRALIGSAGMIRQFGFMGSARYAFDIAFHDYVRVDVGQLTVRLNREQATQFHALNSMDNLVRLVEAIPGSPTTVLDVGANCGVFSVLVARRFPKARIYAFEPAPALQKVLAANCAGLNIVILPTAVLDRLGDMELYINESSQQTNSMFRERVTPYARAVISLQVPTVTLDDFVSREELKKIDVLKIDVQGAEFAVLSGGAKTLEITDALLMEVWLSEPNVFEAVELARRHFPYQRAINLLTGAADILFTRVPS